MLENISDILVENKIALNKIIIDIAGNKNQRVGRNGLNGDQVLRCAVLKNLMNFTHEKLEFHFSDSQAMRVFAKLNYGQNPSKSSLQKNIKAIPKKHGKKYIIGVGSRCWIN